MPSLAANSLKEISRTMPSPAANSPFSGDHRNEKVKKKELKLFASEDQTKRKKKMKNRENGSRNEVEEAMNGHAMGFEGTTAKRKSSESAGYESSPKRSRSDVEEEEEEKRADEEEEPSSELEQDPNAVPNFGMSGASTEKLKSKGIESLFPIQAMTFQTIFSGSDLVGRARTGQDAVQKDNPVAIWKKLPLPDTAVEFQVPDWLRKLLPFMQDAVQKNNPVAIWKKLPLPDCSVEFQVPDWFRKRKTRPYTFIKRNIYVTKKKPVMDDGMQCFCGSSSPGKAIVCGETCLCRAALSSCSSSCTCAGSCPNKPFNQRVPKRLKLSKTEKCGIGLKADEDIEEGEFLIEYVGEVIDDKTCEERLWKMKERGETNFYLCEINREMVIDATFKGNKSRYINHSCVPNTQIHKWETRGETRIGVFAIRNIKRGEFVTYDYHFVGFGREQRCYCGTQNCRGVLGAKRSKQQLSSDAAMKLVAQEVAGLKASKSLSHEASTEGALVLASSHNEKRDMEKCIGQRVRIYWPVDKSYYKGRISGYDLTSKKHTIVYDDGDEESLDMSKEIWDFNSTQECQTVMNGSLESCSDSTSASIVEQR